MNLNQSKSERFFRKISKVTLVSVYFLILVGGVVRSTGSGMGCPDWPKCFGSVVPPTHVSQLPEDYKEVYAEQRAEKNTRLVGYLRSVGLSNTADRIEADESILIEQDFNATKTWIEYLNRLIGALIGLFIFMTFIASFTYLKKDPTVFVLSLLTLVLVGLQGWIGSIVVSTNLLPGMISIHMLLALLIVSIILYMVFRTNSHQEFNFQGITSVKSLVIIGIILMAVQIILGTQVREEVDTVSALLGYENRAEWVSNLGSKFYVHRSYSLVILLLHGYLLYRLFKIAGKQDPMFINLAVLVALIGMEILFGALMAYFAIPPYLQPLHLVLATLIFGNQCYILYSLNYKSKPKYSFAS